MKKLFVILFLLTSLFALFGCGLSYTTSVAPLTTLGNEQYYNLLISKIQLTTYGNSSTNLPIIAGYLDHLPDSYSDVAALRQQYNEVDTAFKKKVALSVDSQYTDMYAFYIAVKTVDEKYSNWNFGDMYEGILKLMFLGKWTSGNSGVSYQKVYSDYANTISSDWFSNNLLDSTIAGTAYYFYIHYENHKLIIGYQDRITNVETDNYQITFSANSISLYSLIESKTYTMSRDTTFTRVVRDNAKMAYEYTARVVSQFKDPQSLVIRKCYVYPDSGYIIIETSAANSVGGLVIKTYKVSKIGNEFYIVETSSISYSNIDVEELNSKVSAYIDTLY
jgi:hypothetical protein